ncbi:MAG: hypothetical protein FK733_14905 [Asgard group archaeon]|nr:hypothetical protein [Asgard group archaeon]
MIRLKSTHKFFLLAVIVAVIACSPVISARGESVQLMYLEFYIEPSQPPVIAEASYELTAANDYIHGIPDTAAVGMRSDSGTYYFEMTSTGHVEVYILDSSGGPTSQYLSYVSSFAGDAPTDYTYFYICDGYLQFNFTTSISPKLIIWSDALEVTGEYTWLEGFTAIEYSSYYVRIAGSDRLTNDTIHIFDVNASISAYIMNDTTFEAFLEDPNVRPEPPDVVASIEDSIEINLNYEPEVFASYYLVLWHEQYFDGVSGSLTYEYSFNRTFFERYWSFLLIIVLLILVIVFAVFRKQAMPPVVWTLEKARHYGIKVPWEQTKSYFKDIGSEFSGLMGRIRGVKEEVELEIVEPSPHRKLVVSLLSLIYPLSIHRFIIGKIGSAIVSILTQVLAIVFLVGGLNQFIPFEIVDDNVIVYDILRPGERLRWASTGIGIVYLILAFVLIMLYIIDVTATFTGCLEDKKEKPILKW